MRLSGPRVALRPFRPADAEAFAAMNRDPLVMRHFTAPLTRAESDAFLARIASHQTAHGFAFWAVVPQGEEAPIGLCGLQHVPFSARFTPAVEIGWRLRPDRWGKGLAEEAARLALGHGFGALGLEEIVAFTAPANAPSWRLMQRLGMRADGGFEHPRLPEGHPLRPQLLYRLARGR